MNRLNSGVRHSQVLQITHIVIIFPPPSTLSQFTVNVLADKFHLDCKRRAHPSDVVGKNMSASGEVMCSRVSLSICPRGAGGVPQPLVPGPFQGVPQPLVPGTFWGWGTQSGAPSARTRVPPFQPGLVHPNQDWNTPSD